MRAILLIVLLYAGACVAQQPTLYRWVDDQGNVHYSDQIPPKYADQARAQLNAQGIVVDRVEAAPTPQELAAAKAKAAAAAKAREARLAQQRLDDKLSLKYQSVVEIKKARDKDIQLVERAVNLSESNKANHLSRIHELVGRAADIERSGRAAPEDLIAKMRASRAEIKELTAYIDKKEGAQAELVAQYAQRIERFREMTAAREAEESAGDH